MNMKIEVAISFLNQIRHIILLDNSWLESTHNQINEAFNIAIEALELKQQILEAGYSGTEERIHIDGRLFAVRELAQ